MGGRRRDLVQKPLDALPLHHTVGDRVRMLLVAVPRRPDIAGDRDSSALLNDVCSLMRRRPEVCRVAKRHVIPIGVCVRP